MTIDRVGSRFYLGLDLGQARDYSAMAIAERRVERTGAHDPVTFVEHTTTRVIVTHLERIPLRTPYPDVVARVRNLTQSFKDRKLEVVMDATGVGAAVRDMLANAGLGVNVLGVTLTGGERVSVVSGGYHVPRHDLLPTFASSFEKRMLEITAPGDAANLLQSEFLRWGRRSTHDDLIFAVALACWKAGGQPMPVYVQGPLPLIHPAVH